MEDNIDDIDNFYNELELKRVFDKFPKTHENADTRFQCQSIFFIASGVGLNPLYCGHFWPKCQSK
jgi:hypothetical protein